MNASILFSSRCTASSEDFAWVQTRFKMRDCRESDRNFSSPPDLLPPEVVMKNWYSSARKRRNRLLVDRRRLCALEHDLLEIQFHTGADEHLRVRVSAQHQRVDLAVVEAVLKTESGRLAKCFEQLRVARHVAEQVGHAGLDVALRFRDREPSIHR